MSAALLQAIVDEVLHLEFNMLNGPIVKLLLLQDNIIGNATQSQRSVKKRKVTKIGEIFTNYYEFICITGGISIGVIVENERI